MDTRVLHCAGVAMALGIAWPGVVGAASVHDDFDGDGRSDVFWRHLGSGDNWIWPGADPSASQNLQSVSVLGWTVVASGDFDGDGRADLFWRDARSGTHAIWSQGLGRASAATRVVNAHWRVQAVGDFDRDGRADLFWHNPRTGANAIWPSASPTNQPSVPGVANLDWTVVGAGDFDGDGRSDVLWRNGRTGASVAWRNGDARTPLTMRAVPDLSWRVVGIGDFDGDGRDDLFWRHGLNGRNAIWNGARAEESVRIPTVSDPYFRVIGAGDFDGDGIDELLWRSIDEGRVVPSSSPTPNATFLWQPYAPRPQFLEMPDSSQGILTFLPSEMRTFPLQSQFLEESPAVISVSSTFPFRGPHPGTVVFTVLLSHPASTPVRYDIATATPVPTARIHLATAGVDYIPKAMTGQVILPGAMSARFTVEIPATVSVAPGAYEAFAVALSNVEGATRGRNGLIVFHDF